MFLISSSFAWKIYGEGHIHSSFLLVKNQKNYICQICCQSSNRNCEIKLKVLMSLMFSLFFWVIAIWLKIRHEGGKNQALSHACLDHNAAIYHSSTSKQCLWLLTFQHSTSCNANRASFSRWVKREQILAVCCLHGFLNQQMAQQNRQFPHLLCPQFMYNVSQKCLQRPRSAHAICEEEHMQSL